MPSFINKLNKINKNKYKNSISTIKFLETRNNYLKKILNMNTKKKLIYKKKIFKKIINDPKNIETKKIINYIHNFKDQKITNDWIIHLYKKFNYSLKLKKFYLKKNNDDEVDLHTYVLFGNILIKQKKIDNLQKLNTICKINDITIIYFDKKKHKNFIEVIKANIEFENKFKVYYAKKFVSYFG
jgi:hypothetical protein|tara:strand:+ start:39 stop:590 length:552 start_codon:yes stop_codon:yes gene_type:complete